MNKRGLAVLSIASAAVGFIGGKIYGFKEGMDNFSLLDQVARGALATYYFTYVEDEEIDQVEFTFELDIDSGLHRYIVYQDSGNKLLSKHFMPEFTTELERYVEVMAEHRRSHPIVFRPQWAKPAEGDDEQVKAWKEVEHSESIEVTEQIKSLLRKRGVSEAALSRQSPHWDE